MRRGDLVRVKYHTDPDPYHGVIFETPEDGPHCIWRMWCIERGKEHVLSPLRDEIVILSKASDISLT